MRHVLYHVSCCMAFGHQLQIIADGIDLFQYIPKIGEQVVWDDTSYRVQSVEYSPQFNIIAIAV